MVKYFKLCSLLLSAGLIFGCASHTNSLAPNAKAYTDNKIKVVLEDNIPQHDPVPGQKLVNKAKTAIGTPYVLGGTEPGGFDCSGLVQWAYNSIGVELPRTAREQSSVGKKIRKVEDMRAGDIVAFRHPKRGYHTGIYVGDGKFIHSPRKRTRVRINSLDEPYFSETLLGARRVALSETSSVVAEAESRLEQYISEKSKLRISSKNLQASNDKKIEFVTSKTAKTKSAKATRYHSKNRSKNSHKNIARNDKKSSKSVDQANSRTKNSSKRQSREVSNLQHKKGKSSSRHRS